MKWLMMLAVVFFIALTPKEAHGKFGDDFDGVIVKMRQAPMKIFPIAGPNFLDLIGFDHEGLLREADRLIADGRFLLIHDRSPEDIEADSDVEWAEPNYIFHISPLPIDIKQEPPVSSWGISKVKAEKAWEKGIKGEGVVVAVIDTGVDWDHPALKGKVLADKGYNFADKTSDARDDHGHGTHVSGTICGDGIGVAPDAKILPIKFLTKSGEGTSADAVDSIHYATKNAVNVISASWGGGEKSKAIFEAIEEAKNSGILFVAAAGNDASDNDKKPMYPASYALPNIIAVAATDKDDSLADFSNYGEKTVDVAAPGVGILSSVLDGKYRKMSGTSMATPHISGMVALMLSNGVKPQHVKARLISGSDPVESLKVQAHGRASVPGSLGIPGLLALMFLGFIQEQ